MKRLLSKWFSAGITPWLDSAAAFALIPRVRKACDADVTVGLGAVVARRAGESSRGLALCFNRFRSQ
jgi:hypothetical protein